MIDNKKPQVVGNLIERAIVRLWGHVNERHESRAERIEAGESQAPWHTVRRDEERSQKLAEYMAVFCIFPRAI